MPRFDYDSAVKEGYTDEEISEYLTQSRPNFKVKEALQEGYNLQEISNHLNEVPEKQDRSALEKGGRVAAQYGLGVLEGSVPGLVYNIGVAPAASQGLADFNERARIGEDIEFLYEKNLGKPVDEWSKGDKELYNSLEEQIKPGGELKYAKPGPDLSIRSLAEKVTGIDFTPEGIAEKAAQWTGWIKDPKKLFELGKTGLKPSDVIKAISPSGKEALQGLGAGSALQIAENEGFGPIGQLAAAVVGDIGTRFTLGLGKGAAKILTNPKEAVAEVTSKFTKKDKLDLQKEIIKDFRDANIQADVGTITNSDLVKWIQSRLAQSGLTGDAIDQLKTSVTNQVKEEYKALANSVGEARFSSSHHAGEVAKDYIKRIRDEELNEIRDTYKKSTDLIKKDAFVDSKKLADKIKEIEESLNPGNIKSSEQNVVLEQLNKLKSDIYDSEGNLFYAKVKDLLNDKIALNDIINYEVQGGSKQLLKGIVSELDRAIISHGKDNPSFAKNYINSNKKFSKHAKTFRNKRVNQLLSDNDPAQLMNKMNTIQGVRDLNNILSKTSIGEDVMNSLKRFKLDKVIQDNFIDSTTQQLKLGTFSKLLEKGKNKDILQEILPKQSFMKLQKLQKNAGRLAESAQKFLNTSKSGITIEDAGIVSKALWDLSNILMGNPWPLLKTAGGISGARYLTKLMGDPEFLKMVEELVLASEKNNITLMEEIGKQLAGSIKAVIISESNYGSDQQKI